MSVRIFRAILSVAGLGLALTACRQKAEIKAPQSPPPPVTATGDAPPAKPKITKLDDLPRHAYPITGKVTDLIISADKFAPLAVQVRADIEKDLATYDIEDKTTLKSLKGTLFMLDLLEGKNTEARALLAELRSMEDKPALKYTTGLISEVRLDVIDQTKLTDETAPVFQQAFQKELSEKVSALPWEVVQDELKQINASFQTRSRNLILGVVESELQPAVDQNGALSYDLAGGVISRRLGLAISLPLKDPVVAALNPIIQAHHVAKPDIWQARDVTLNEAQKLMPVVIGIWDSGVDGKLFPGRLYTNPYEVVDGKDDDGNGFVDDVHGIAFDLHSNRVVGSLYPLGKDVNRLPELKSQIKGLLDLEAAVDSPEAGLLRQKMSTLGQDQVKPFLEDLGLFGNYIHGTHVAGIASAGNPFARILIARITFDYHLIPEKPTIEQAQKDVAADQAAVDYFKAHGVRVVNMSWGGSLKDVEDALEKNKVKDPVERAREARQIFDIGRDGLFNAMKSAPDILFVTAAGNSNNDVNFDEVIPSSFVLPNLITVGAVDQAGDETSFTSFGKNVNVYANGFEVDSLIPGGSHLKLSGTSMASPEVANLAAKLFALNPKLQVADVIDLIKKGIAPSEKDARILLINSKKSVELLNSSSASIK